MVEWLVPVGLFWIAAAVYLGGMPVEIEGGGGVRQLLGLAVLFALFLVVWAAARAVLGGVGPRLGRVVLPTLVTVLLLPLTSRLAFRILGIRLRRAEANH
ncbi:MAG: hypothetical protein ACE5HQ_09590 [Gemmatimonadota bacterium]